MEHVQEAAKLAFAHEFISALPDGYDTDIGQRGGLLSGGQKQRVAIARSVVSSPKILLLDEATSALDPYAESVVQQALDKASKGRTTIVVAHKLATIRKADNIVVMSKGVIAEQGTHESLLMNNGVYSRLVAIQSLAASDSESAPEKQGAETDEEAHTEVMDDAKSLTRYATSVRQRMQASQERDDYDGHKQQGIISAVASIARQTPELSLAYLSVVAACLIAGKYNSMSHTSHTLIHADFMLQAAPSRAKQYFWPMSSMSLNFQGQRCSAKETSTPRCTSLLLAAVLSPTSS